MIKKVDKVDFADAAANFSPLKSYINWATIYNLKIRFAVYLIADIFEVHLLFNQQMAITISICLKCTPWSNSICNLNNKLLNIGYIKLSVASYRLRLKKRCLS